MALNDALAGTSRLKDITATPTNSRRSPAASSRPRIAEAGEGVETAVNPLQGLIRNLAVPTKEEYDAAEQPRTASTSTTPGVASDKASRLVEEAKKWIGSPYVWGASRPGAFDCSGFIQYIYKQNGINLPRVSYQQMAAGRKVDKNDLQVGDLLGWDYSGRNPGADHIAMYIGNGQIIHTNTPGKPLRIESLSSKPQNFAASRIL